MENNEQRTTALCKVNRHGAKSLPTRYVYLTVSNDSIISEKRQGIKF